MGKYSVKRSYEWLNYAIYSTFDNKKRFPLY